MADNIHINVSSVYKSCTVPIWNQQVPQIKYCKNLGSIFTFSHGTHSWVENGQGGTEWEGVLFVLFVGFWLLAFFKQLYLFLKLRERKAVPN